jgi:hypothetical protein
MSQHRDVILQGATGSASVAAWRCWSWRLCPFGCRHVDDCILTTPLTVHDRERVGGDAKSLGLGCAHDDESCPAWRARKGAA